MRQIAVRQTNKFFESLSTAQKKHIGHLYGIDGESDTAVRRFLKKYRRTNKTLSGVLR